MSKPSPKENNNRIVKSCPNCRSVVDQKPTGRPAIFCKAHCRVQYWRKQKKAGNGRLQSAILGG